MKSTFTKAAFDRLPDEKKTRILNAAVHEFSSHGFESANINIIAERAAISVGSLYKYFDNKQGLYLALVSYSVQRTQEALEKILSKDHSLMEMIEEIIRTIQSVSKQEIGLTKLYSKMTLESNQKLLNQAAAQMEGVTANLYAELIEKAQKKGEIRTDLSPRYFAFFLDNLFITLQFSYSCEYYQNRMKLFLDENALQDDEQLVSEMMNFIEKALK